MMTKNNQFLTRKKHDDEENRMKHVVHKRSNIKCVYKKRLWKPLRKKARSEEEKPHRPKPEEQEGMP
jgi:hypothetical protein